MKHLTLFKEKHINELLNYTDLTKKELSEELNKFQQWANRNGGNISNSLINDYLHFTYQIYQ